MALKVKIDPIEREIAATIRRDLSVVEQQKAAAAFARAGIEEAKATNRMILGRVPPLTIWVDGRQGAALETVRPNGGTIVGEFDLIEEVLRWIGEELVKRSPFVSGEYVRGHALFADGQEVHLGGQIPLAEEYTFVNRVVYARRLEIGKTKSGRAFLVQVPNRIYERVARDARGRFGNMADIKFGYRSLFGGGRKNATPAITVRSRQS